MTTTETAPGHRARLRRPRPAGRKLAIICSKGNLDMAYPGLILANAALGEGVETHLFFTFWGFDMITKKTMDDLKFTLLGNTATHMPQGLGGLPGMTAHGHPTAEEVDRRPRRPRGPRVPRADRRLRRSPVGLPDVRRHEPPRPRTTSTTRSRASSAPPTSSRRPTAPSCSSSDASSAACDDGRHRGRPSSPVRSEPGPLTGQPSLDAAHAELHPGLHARGRHQEPDPALHGAHRCAERAGDRLVGQTGEQQGQDPRVQPGQRLGPLSSLNPSGPGTTSTASRHTASNSATSASSSPLGWTSSAPGTGPSPGRGGRARSSGRPRTASAGRSPPAASARHAPDARDLVVQPRLLLQHRALEHRPVATPRSTARPRRCSPRCRRPRPVP